MQLGATVTGYVKGYFHEPPPPTPHRGDIQDSVAEGRTGQLCSKPAGYAEWYYGADESRPTHTACSS